MSVGVILLGCGSYWLYKAKQISNWTGEINKLHLLKVEVLHKF